MCTAVQGTSWAVKRGLKADYQHLQSATLWRRLRAWLSVEMPPRMAMGAISDRYRGTYSDAAPHAMPASRRPAHAHRCRYYSV